MYKKIISVLENLSRLRTRLSQNSPYSMPDIHLKKHAPRTPQSSPYSMPDTHLKKHVPRPPKSPRTSSSSSQIRPLFLPSSLSSSSSETSFTIPSDYKQNESSFVIPRRWSSEDSDSESECDESLSSNPDDYDTAPFTESSVTSDDDSSHTPSDSEDTDIKEDTFTFNYPRREDNSNAISDIAPSDSTHLSSISFSDTAESPTEHLDLLFSHPSHENITNHSSPTPSDNTLPTHQLPSSSDIQTDHLIPEILRDLVNITGVPFGANSYVDIKEGHQRLSLNGYYSNKTVTLYSDLLTFMKSQASTAPSTSNAPSPDNGIPIFEPDVYQTLENDVNYLIGHLQHIIQPKNDITATNTSDFLNSEQENNIELYSQNLPNPKLDTTFAATALEKIIATNRAATYVISSSGSNHVVGCIIEIHSQDIDRTHQIIRDHPDNSFQHIMVAKPPIQFTYTLTNTGHGLSHHTKHHASKYPPYIPERNRGKSCVHLTRSCHISADQLSIMIGLTSALSKPNADKSKTIDLLYDLQNNGFFYTQKLATAPKQIYINDTISQSATVGSSKNPMVFAVRYMIFKRLNPDSFPNRWKNQIQWIQNKPITLDATLFRHRHILQDLVKELIKDTPALSRPKPTKKKKANDAVLIRILGTWLYTNAAFSRRIATHTVTNDTFQHHWSETDSTLTLKDMTTLAETIYVDVCHFMPKLQNLSPDDYTSILLQATTLPPITHNGTPLTYSKLHKWLESSDKKIKKIDAQLAQKTTEIGKIQKTIAEKKEIHDSNKHASKKNINLDDFAERTFKQELKKENDKIKKIRQQMVNLRLKRTSMFKAMATIYRWLKKEGLQIKFDIVINGILPALLTQVLRKKGIVISNGYQLNSSQDFWRDHFRNPTLSDVPLVSDALSMLVKRFFVLTLRQGEDAFRKNNTTRSLFESTANGVIVTSSTLVKKLESNTLAQESDVEDHPLIRPLMADLLRIITSEKSTLDQRWIPELMSDGQFSMNCGYKYMGAILRYLLLNRHSDSLDQHSSENRPRLDIYKALLLQQKTNILAKNLTMTQSLTNYDRKLRRTIWQLLQESAIKLGASAMKLRRHNAYVTDNTLTKINGLISTISQISKTELTRYLPEWDSNISQQFKINERGTQFRLNPIDNLNMPQLNQWIDNESETPSSFTIFRMPTLDISALIGNDPRNAIPNWMEACAEQLAKPEFQQHPLAALSEFATRWATVWTSKKGFSHMRSAKHCQRFLTALTHMYQQLDTLWQQLTPQQHGLIPMTAHGLRLYFQAKKLVTIKLMMEAALPTIMPYLNLSSYNSNDSNSEHKTIEINLGLRQITLNDYTGGRLSLTDILYSFPNINSALIHNISDINTGIRPADDDTTIQLELGQWSRYISVKKEDIDIDILNIEETNFPDLAIAIRFLIAEHAIPLTISMDRFKDLSDTVRLPANTLVHVFEESAWISNDNNSKIFTINPLLLRSILMLKTDDSWPEELELKLNDRTFNYRSWIFDKAIFENRETLLEQGRLLLFSPEHRLLPPIYYALMEDHQLLRSQLNDPDVRSVSFGYTPKDKSCTPIPGRFDKLTPEPLHHLADEFTHVEENHRTITLYKKPRQTSLTNGFHVSAKSLTKGHYSKPFVHRLSGLHAAIPYHIILFSQALDGHHELIASDFSKYVVRRLVSHPERQCDLVFSIYTHLPPEIDESSHIITPLSRLLHRLATYLVRPGHLQHLTDYIESFVPLFDGLTQSHVGVELNRRFAALIPVVQDLVESIIFRVKTLVRRDVLQPHQPSDQRKKQLRHLARAIQALQIIHATLIQYYQKNNQPHDTLLSDYLYLKGSATRIYGMLPLTDTPLIARLRLVENHMEAIIYDTIQAQNLDSSFHQWISPLIEQFLFRLPSQLDWKGNYPIYHAMNHDHICLNINFHTMEIIGPGQEVDSLSADIQNHSLFQHFISDAGQMVNIQLHKHRHHAIYTFKVRNFPQYMIRVVYSNQQSGVSIYRFYSEKPDQAELLLDFESLKTTTPPLPVFLTSDYLYWAKESMIKVETSNGEYIAELEQNSSVSDESTTDHTWVIRHHHYIYQDLLTMTAIPSLNHSPTTKQHPLHRLCQKMNYPLKQVIIWTHPAIAADGTNIDDTTAMPPKITFHSLGLTFLWNDTTRHYQCDTDPLKDWTWDLNAFDYGWLPFETGFRLTYPGREPVFLIPNFTVAESAGLHKQEKNENSISMSGLANVRILSDIFDTTPLTVNTDADMPNFLVFPYHKLHETLTSSDPYSALRQAWLYILTHDYISAFDAVCRALENQTLHPKHLRDFRYINHIKHPDIFPIQLMTVCYELLAAIHPERKEWFDSRITQSSFHSLCEWFIAQAIQNKAVFQLTSPFNRLRETFFSDILSILEWKIYNIESEHWDRSQAPSDDEAKNDMHTHASLVKLYHVLLQVFDRHFLTHDSVIPPRINEIDQAKTPSFNELLKQEKELATTWLSNHFSKTPPPSTTHHAPMCPKTRKALSKKIKDKGLDSAINKQFTAVSAYIKCLKLPRYTNVSDLKLMMNAIEKSRKDYKEHITHVRQIIQSICSHDTVIDQSLRPLPKGLMGHLANRYLTGSITELAAECQLDESTSKQLLGYIETYMLLTTHMATLDRWLAMSKTIQKLQQDLDNTPDTDKQKTLDDTIDNLGNELANERSYGMFRSSSESILNPEVRACLHFEFSTGFRIREKQMEIIHRILLALTKKNCKELPLTNVDLSPKFNLDPTSTGIFEQLQMGGGKTAVIMVVVASALALYKDKYPTIIVPEPLIGQLSDRLNVAFDGRFRHIVTIQFNRKMDYSGYQFFIQARSWVNRTKHGVFLMAPAVYQGLGLKLIEKFDTLLNTPHLSKEYTKDTLYWIKGLQHLMSTIRSGYMICDEVDTILKIETQVTYALGKESHVWPLTAKWSIIVMTTILKHLDHSDKSRSSTDTSTFKPVRNIFGQLIRAYHPELLASDPKLRRKIAKDLLQQLITDATRNDQWRPPKKPKYDDLIIFLTEEIPTTSHSNDIITQIKELCQNYNEKTRNFFETLTFIREWLVSLADAIFSKEYLIQFGPNLSKEEMLSRQQQGNSHQRHRMQNVPFRYLYTPAGETTEFVFPEIKVGTTLLSYLSQGLWQPEIKETITELKTMDDSIMKAVFNDTLNHKKLKETDKPLLCKGRLRDIDLDNPEQVQLLDRFVGHHQDMVRYFLDYIFFVNLPKMHPTEVTSYCHDIVSKQAAAGFSGTNEQDKTYPNHLQLSSSPEIEGRILYYMTHKRNAQVIAIDGDINSVESDEFFTNICHHIQTLPNCQALIDGAAIIRRKTGIQVARGILKHAQRITQVVFYKNATSSAYILNREGQLKVFREHDKMLPFGSLVVYDDSHTVGTDYKFQPTAVGLSTAREDMLLAQKSQADYRMRGIELLQQIITLIPNHDYIKIAAFFNQKTITHSHLLATLTRNSRDAAKNAEIMSISQKMNQPFRVDAINAMLAFQAEATDQHQQKTMSTLVSQLIDHHPTTPSERFLHPSESLPIHQAIEERYKQALSAYSDYLTPIGRQWMEELNIRLIKQMAHLETFVLPKSNPSAIAEAEQNANKISDKIVSKETTSNLETKNYSFDHYAPKKSHPNLILHLFSDPKNYSFASLRCNQSFGEGSFQTHVITPIKDTYIGAPISLFETYNFRNTEQQNHVQKTPGFMAVIVANGFTRCLLISYEEAQILSLLPHSHLKAALFLLPFGEPLSTNWEDDLCIKKWGDFSCDYRIVLNAMFYLKTRNLDFPALPPTADVIGNQFYEKYISFLKPIYKQVEPKILKLAENADLAKGLDKWDVFQHIKTLCHDDSSEISIGSAIGRDLLNLLEEKVLTQLKTSMLDIVREFVQILAKSALSETARQQAGEGYEKMAIPNLQEISGPGTVDLNQKESIMRDRLISKAFQNDPTIATTQLLKYSLVECLNRMHSNQSNNDRNIGTRSLNHFKELITHLDTYRKLNKDKTKSIAQKIGQSSKIAKQIQTHYHPFIAYFNVYSISDEMLSFFKTTPELANHKDKIKQLRHIRNLHDVVFALNKTCRALLGSNPEKNRIGGLMLQYFLEEGPLDMGQNHYANILEDDNDYHGPLPTWDSRISNKLIQIFREDNIAHHLSKKPHLLSNTQVVVFDTLIQMLRPHESAKKSDIQAIADALRKEVATS